MNNILDTNIIIDALRGYSLAIGYLDRLEKKIITSVTVSELLLGCHSKSEVKKIEDLLESFEIIYATEKDSRLSIEILKENFLKTGIYSEDALIAAICTNKKATLVTKNSKHFDSIKNLKIKIPY